MESIWMDAAPPDRMALFGDMTADALVIGGGMAGILTAHALQAAGLHCVVVEANRIGSGTSGASSAKITVGHGLIYTRLMKESRQKAAAYLAANQAALKDYFKLCETIDCDFSIQTNYVYAVDGERQVEDEANALLKLGQAATVCSRLPVPIYAHAVALPTQAQFHPVKFIAAISRDLTVFENTPVLRVQEKTAICEKGTVSARHIVFACHFPFVDTSGGYFLKLYQHRSYILALQGVPQFEGMYVDDATKGMSFRCHGEYLLVGGGDHRTGKSGGGYEELHSFARRHYPEAKVARAWAAQDCMSLDAVPYVGGYSAGRPGWYVATGFNKWGMTGAMVAARLLAGMILRREGFRGELALTSGDFNGIFRPNRSMLQKQLFINGGEALVNLLTPSTPRCTHMGCALKWNPAEKSWDCMCHGSRFGETGEILNGPAAKPAKLGQRK